MIKQTIRLDDEEVFEAIRKYLKDKGVEVYDEAHLRFPSTQELDVGEHYIEIVQ